MEPVAFWGGSNLSPALVPAGRAEPAVDSGPKPGQDFMEPEEHLDHRLNTQISGADF